MKTFQIIALATMVAMTVVGIAGVLLLFVSFSSAAKPVKQCREVTYLQADYIWKSKHQRCFRV